MYVAHAAFCMSVWHGNGLRMRIRRTFEHRQHSEKAFLRLFVHGNVQLTWVSDTHAWTLPLVSDTHACTLPLVSDTQTCVVRSPPNISSKTCHRRIWAALRSQGRRQSSCGTFCEKNSKCDVKNSFWPRKIQHVTAVPFAYLQVLAYFFGREI